MKSTEQFESYLAESDRGCALIAFEFICRNLEELHKAKIKSHVKSPEKMLKDLFRWPGMLASASARIELAFAYGLITRDTYDDLLVVKTIRNKAAHNDDAFSFSKFKNEIRNIGAVSRVHQNPEFPKAMELAFQDKSQGNLPIKTVFASVAMSLAVEIAIATSHEVLKRDYNEKKSE